MDEKIKRMINSQDATLWAEAWCEMYAEQMAPMDPEETKHVMISWFANALQTGETHGRSREARDHSYEAGMAAAGIPISSDPHEAIFPKYDEIDDEKMQSIIYQALGVASMCWIPQPHTQLFDSTRAKNIGDETVALLNQYVHEKIVALEDKVAEDIRNENKEEGQ